MDRTRAGASVVSRGRRVVARLGRERGRQRDRIRSLEEYNRSLEMRISELESGATSARPVPVDDLGHVFVLTYARSGSTLLQGLLNAIPGYLVRGENGGAFHHLAEFHRVLKDARDAYGPAAVPTHPWFGVGGYPEQQCLELMRGLVRETVLRPQPDTRVTGFKEIRWWGSGIGEGEVGPWIEEDLARLVGFVRLLFPEARFVVNTRRLDDVASSKIWRDRPHASAMVAALDASLRDMAETLGPAAFHLHYDDYVTDPDRLAGLFEWLGEPFDAESARAVLGVRHSY